VQLCLYEDAAVADLEPLALTRPAFDLWCGAGPLLRRQLRWFGADSAHALVRRPLAELCRLEHPELTVNEPSSLWGRPVVLVNARWLPPVDVNADLLTPHLGVIDGETVYAVVPDLEEGGAWPEDPAWRVVGWRDVLPQRPAGGALMAHPWDLVERNPEALRQDDGLWRRERGPSAAPPGVTLLGPPDGLLLDPEAELEPWVVVDARRGPVMVDRGARVQAFSRLEGPCYVGPGTQVLGARLRGGTLGPECRIGGEVEASIVQGYANKYHDGFLGHSYVGAWVNLGAGTQVSDLRNDYGPVRVTINGRALDTGLTKVGAFVGDHTRTGIGALFNTGTVVGPFCQILASEELPPRAAPAFCQFGRGRLSERHGLRQLMATTETVLKRRGREWTAAHEEFFFGLFEQTAETRRQALREAEQRRLRRVVG
jgi:UDP-N-acetylglucosamine diphosphorylase/glucosamine-1-phosphate N-acetyltransferase